jgi:CDP-diacylglycerol--serine O-phosphatidyltransferase
VVAANLLVVALLMVSRVPTFSFKAVKLRHEHLLPAMVLMAAVAALTATFLWWVLLLVELAYIATIPLSIRAHARDEAAKAEPEPKKKAKS